MSGKTIYFDVDELELRQARRDLIIAQGLVDRKQASLANAERLKLSKLATIARKSLVSAMAGETAV